ncbi:hypothetical protein J3U09_05485 [Gilliamella sp. B2889]|uniref:hypothetical protein n=1 Tax=Gilliamella sp. B2889 TaxID=2817985 RepID=UPI00226AEEAF|nr:hypothetical protein [Gilliamella sp. B2889]MCX8683174.1 hypothetical protein [Gilliamella sp. B2889]
MKKLAIKKIALSLFLAGYAASSAYAISPVTTTNAVQGSAPVMWSQAGTAAHTMTVRISNNATGTTAIGSGEKAKVGDYIHIFYNLKDSDGDQDPTSARKVAGTLTVWMKLDRVNGAWQQVTDITDTAIAYEADGEKGHISFQISNSMAGAEQIGFQLEERTEFGSPDHGKWLSVADIWSTANPPKKDDTKPNDPGTGDEGPGDPDPDNPVGPVELPGATALGIFKYKADGSVDLAVNLATTGNTDEASTPMYGDKLAAIVWLNNSGGAVSNAPNFTGSTPDMNKSSAYSFTWHLDGTYAGDAAPAAAINVGLGRDNTHGYGTIELGDISATVKHNSKYSMGTKAGLQGYKLKVTAN